MGYGRGIRTANLWSLILLRTYLTPGDTGRCFFSLTRVTMVSI